MESAPLSTTFAQFQDDITEEFGAFTASRFAQRLWDHRRAGWSALAHEAQRLIESELADRDM